MCCLVVALGEDTDEPLKLFDILIEVAKLFGGCRVAGQRLEAPDRFPAVVPSIVVVGREFAFARHVQAIGFDVLQKIRVVVQSNAPGELARGVQTQTVDADLDQPRVVAPKGACISLDVGEAHGLRDQIVPPIEQARTRR